ncbi:TetR/AcrR family transcriptional regulator [Pengzhenrongella sicca]|uniref:TetR/AcrR family transcriptional regulator C-terminal domain-containing protein n=1 Tax=Pengzhenrongella sicca TaxID=2819238 RepID=A0A8A4ZHP9_9MICO|nr:TetR/AcrR family transcriptional regulator C-terminal domain-containing protein [Pengzhenrongella sicca]QTE30493.1 TetR/AcrR family transcriptional regulator C-terminal domain-containing protein [Pengzhenrongella sicca]
MPAPLSPERIVDAAIALADREGLEGLSMRKLGVDLGVDPMSVYHHVADKSALLALMVDRVVGQVEPVRVGGWAEALRGTILGARATMLRHPWAAKVLAAGTEATPAIIGYVDAILGILRGGGLTVGLAHHALHVLGSRILGFSQDLFDDAAEPRPDLAARAALAARWAQTLPNVAELALAADHDGGLGGCDDDAEFAFALDLIIEGLALRHAPVP